MVQVLFPFGGCNPRFEALVLLFWTLLALGALLLAGAGYTQEATRVVLASAIGTVNSLRHILCCRDRGGGPKPGGTRFSG